MFHLNLLAGAFTDSRPYPEIPGRAVSWTLLLGEVAQIPRAAPSWSVILDVEPMRQGEEECATALRLLKRLRESYGPRFFDVVLVDPWSTNGPFLQAVVAMGWPVISVLKQERYDIYGEALALTKGQRPAQTIQREGRTVEIWDLPQMTFTGELPGSGARGARARNLATTRTQRRKMDHQGEGRKLDVDRGLSRVTFQELRKLGWRGLGRSGPRAELPPRRRTGASLSGNQRPLKKEVRT